MTSHVRILQRRMPESAAWEIIWTIACEHDYGREKPSSGLGDTLSRLSAPSLADRRPSSCHHFLGVLLEMAIYCAVSVSIGALRGGQEETASYLGSFPGALQVRQAKGGSGRAVRRSRSITRLGPFRRSRWFWADPARRAREHCCGHRGRWLGRSRVNPGQTPVGGSTSPA